MAALARLDSQTQLAARQGCLFLGLYDPLLLQWQFPPRRPDMAETTCFGFCFLLLPQFPLRVKHVTANMRCIYICRPASHRKLMQSSQHPSCWNNARTRLAYLLNHDTEAAEASGIPCKMVHVYFLAGLVEIMRMLRDRTLLKKALVSPSSSVLRCLVTGAGSLVP